MVRDVSASTPESGDEQDWRLKAALGLELGEVPGALRSLLARLRASAREPDVLGELASAVPADAVLTHDGRLLFVYANTLETLRAARAAIEGVLRRDGVSATIEVAHWEEELDEWVQVEPPPSAEQRAALAGRRRDAAEVETRTLVANVGRMVKDEVEQTMRSWAERIGVECEVLEHPHLLSSQVAFTVTGPKGLIDEFARGLRAEELATIRTETAVMGSPL